MIHGGSRARLTRRELAILRLIAEGRSNREVANLLWVTEQTVKFHLMDIYRKLDVRNRFEASRWAIRRGLADPDDPEAAAGVREPRRPIKPTLIDGVALDLPPTSGGETDRDVLRQAA